MYRAVGPTSTLPHNVFVRCAPRLSPCAMRQWIDKPADPILFRAHKFAIFSAHRINPIRGQRRAKHRRHFIGIKPGAIHQAARFNFSSRAAHAHDSVHNFQTLHLGVHRPGLRRDR